MSGTVGRASSIRRLLSTGTSSGKWSNAALGASPTSSARATGAWRRTASTTSTSGVRRWSSTFVDTCAMPRWASQIPIARTDAQALGAAFADQRGDRPGVLERRRRRQLDVEGDQWRASSHENRAGGRMQAARSEVGSLLAVPDPLREGGQAAASQLSARAPAREIAVEEHGKLELARRACPRAPAPPRSRRRGLRRPGRRSAQRRSRRRADALPRGSVTSMISNARRAPARTAGASSPGAPASVNTVRWWSGSKWTSSRARAERGADRVDRRLVAPLGEVRDGEQRGRHAPSSPST